MGDSPLTQSRCEHGVPDAIDCEQCRWARHVADDQAADDDWMFDPRWESSDE